MAKRMPRVIKDIDGEFTLFTPEELGQYLGLSSITIRHRAAKDPSSLPPFINIGTDKRPLLRFPARDVREFIRYLMTQRSSTIKFVDDRTGQKEETLTPSIDVDESLDPIKVDD